MVYKPQKNERSKVRDGVQISKNWPLLYRGWWSILKKMSVVRWAMVYKSQKIDRCYLEDCVQASKN